MTWAALLSARLAGVMDDIPTRLALGGLAGCLALSGVMVRWASQHYVRSAATGWHAETWERFTEAERTDTQERKLMRGSVADGVYDGGRSDADIDVGRFG